MCNESSSLANWTPEELANGRRWVQAWREAGQEMERLRREELRRLDGLRAIALLCGPPTIGARRGRRGQLPGYRTTAMVQEGGRP